MAEVLPGNGLVSTLASGISAAATTLSIQSGDAVRWPASGEYRAVLCNNPTLGPWEIVRVVGGQGTATLTVQRAVEPYNGTQTAAIWATGTTISGVVTNAGLNQRIVSASDNLLTNPGFEQWSRGTGPFTTHNGFSADRWQQNDTVAIQAVGGYSSGYAAQIVRTSSGTASGLLQRVSEIDLRNKTLTLSFKVQCNTVGAVRTWMYTDSAGTYNAYGPLNTTTGWETHSLTFSLDGTTTYVTMGINLFLPCTVLMDDAMLVYGSVPADYVSPHPTDDLARCQRYFQTFDWNGIVVGGSAAQAGNREFTQVAWLGRMGGQPTYTWVGSFAAANTPAATPDFWGGNRGAFGLSLAATAPGEFFLQGGSTSLRLEWNP